MLWQPICPNSNALGGWTPDANLCVCQSFRLHTLRLVSSRVHVVQGCSQYRATLHHCSCSCSQAKGSRVMHIHASFFAAQE